MIKIIIGKPVEQVSYRSKFKIVAYYEHGDADQYTETEQFYPGHNQSRLERDIRGLKFMLSDSFPVQWEPKKQAKALTEALGEDADGFCDSFHEHDCTDGGNDNFAKLTGFNVTFFDHNGIEYEVQYTLEGEQNV